MSIEPFQGNPNFPLIEKIDEGFLLRHIDFCKGIEPQLFLVEQSFPLGKIPSIFAQGIYRESIWREYAEQLMHGKFR